MAPTERNKFEWYDTYIFPDYECKISNTVHQNAFINSYSSTIEMQWMDRQNKLEIPLSHLLSMF